MVFLSAVCVKGFDKEHFNYITFFTKRCIRLILPVWIFFALYYIGVYIFYYLPPINNVIASFTFTSDLYVWIIRILVILSMLSPIIWRLSHKLTRTTLLIILFAVFASSEWLFNIHSGKIANMILMTIPYGLVYMLGLNIRQFSKTQLLTLSGSLFAAFLVLCGYLWAESGDRRHFT